LRGLFDTQTDYDLDTRFTDAQKQIILTALRGLANHPIYGPAMAALAAKGADINIIADFSGEYTGSDRGQTRGRNSDGTIDQGESITVYINMNPGGCGNEQAECRRNQPYGQERPSKSAIKAGHTKKEDAWHNVGPADCDPTPLLQAPFSRIRLQICSCYVPRCRWPSFVARSPRDARARKGGRPDFGARSH
jgi:hypothetical protein